MELNDLATTLKKRKLQVNTYTKKYASIYWLLHQGTNSLSYFYIQLILIL